MKSRDDFDQAMNDIVRGAYRYTVPTNAPHFMVSPEKHDQLREAYIKLQECDLDRALTLLRGALTKQPGWKAKARKFLDAVENGGERE